MNLIINNYDIIFLIIILISTALALFHGAVSETLSLSVWVFSIIATKDYSSYFNKYLSNSITNTTIRTIVIFVIFFILFSIIVTIFKKVLKKIIKFIGLGSLDFILGIIFGFIRGILICSVLVLFIEGMHLDPNSKWKQSKINYFLLPSINWINKTIADNLPNSKI